MSISLRGRHVSWYLCVNSGEFPGPRYSGPGPRTAVGPTWGSRRWLRWVMVRLRVSSRAGLRCRGSPHGAGGGVGAHGSRMPGWGPVCWVWVWGLCWPGRRLPAGRGRLPLIAASVAVPAVTWGIRRQAVRCIRRQLSRGVRQRRRPPLHTRHRRPPRRLGNPGRSSGCSFPTAPQRIRMRGY